MSRGDISFLGATYKDKMEKHYKIRSQSQANSCHLILLVFDASRAGSFEFCRELYQNLSTCQKNSVILVANKSDLIRGQENVLVLKQSIYNFIEEN